MSTVNSMNLAYEFEGIDMNHPSETLDDIMDFSQIYDQCDQTDIDQFENLFQSGNENLAANQRLGRCSEIGCS